MEQRHTVDMSSHALVYTQSSSPPFTQLLFHKILTYSGLGGCLSMFLVYEEKSSASVGEWQDLALISRGNG